MARRNRSEAEAPAEATSSEAREATVTSTTEEASVQAEATSTDEAKAAEVDLSAFQAAVDAAVADKDTSTGEVPTALVAPVQSEYRALDGLKAKNAAKALLNDAMKDSMNKMDLQSARAYLQLQEACSSAGGHKVERAPADPTEAFVQRIAGLEMASQIATANVPEGVAEDWSDKVQTTLDSVADQAGEYLAYLQADEDSRGDEPSVPGWVKAAVKLAQGKAARVGSAGRTGASFTGERRDIGKHIEEAFEGVEPGTFLTIAEIRKHRSSEYGDNPPSAGAISARLFPKSGKSTVPGVEPGTNDKGNKGATKL